ncbi:MAG: autoantigen p27 domain-containing protein [Thermoproteota archaeon]|nr:autoantigen p27 domain-containing protein [Thermoproteota archaeon]
MNNDILKKGADYLLKGGTLLSEPCQICNGLLIKFKGDTICLNCQKSDVNNQELEKVTDQVLEEENIETSQKTLGKNNINNLHKPKEIENYKDLLSQIEKTITKLILESNKLISNENDLDKQKKNLKVLFIYLKILEKIKKIE